MTVRRPAAVTLAATLAFIVLAAGGCVSLTGRTAARWVDDQAITAKVKTRLAGIRTGTLVDVNVDTYEGVVYLSGAVDSPETKQRIEDVAQAVKNVEQVVVNVTVRRPASPAPAAASPGSEGIAGRLEMGAHPMTHRLPGIQRIEADPPVRPRGPWAAYDAENRLVATIYTVGMPELAQKGLDELRPLGGAVDHVSIYPLTARADMPESQYHIVLWHVSSAEAALLQ
jgi:hyperosmotically inducible protein